MSAALAERRAPPALVERQEPLAQQTCARSASLPACWRSICILIPRGDSRGRKTILPASLKCIGLQARRCGWNIFFAWFVLETGFGRRTGCWVLMTGGANFRQPATDTPQLFRTLHMEARLLANWKVTPKGGAEMVTLRLAIRSRTTGPLGSKPLPWASLIRFR